MSPSRFKTLLVSKEVCALLREYSLPFSCRYVPGLVLVEYDLVKHRTAEQTEQIMTEVNGYLTNAGYKTQLSNPHVFTITVN